MHIILDAETKMVNFEEFNQSLDPSHTDNWPRLLQLAYIVKDAGGIEIFRYNELINPEGFTFLPRKSPFDNIKLEDCMEKGVSLKSAITTLFGWIQKGFVPVGHNVDYDLRVCQCEDYRLTNGYIDVPYFMDTAKMAKSKLGMNGNHGYGPKLGDLYFHLFKSSFEGHDALEDVIATDAVFFTLLSL